MAEIETSRNIAGVPAGESMPKPIPQSEQVETIPLPNIQGAYSNYGEATNWASGIGSAVATRSSNAIAQRIGGELGSKPQGDIGIPMTEFDKVMRESYNTQAQATLGLEASKLITDSNIEMAKANRLSPAMISKTNQSVSLGLQNIFKDAPQEIRPNLEYQYGHMQLAQTQDLSERMFREQREDRKNDSALASQKYAENAYSAAMRGDPESLKVAQQYLDANKAMNDANVAARIVDPVTANTYIDTARISMLSGREVGKYNAANKAGQGPEYLKSLADNKPADISDVDYQHVMNNVLTYANQQQSLQNQSEQYQTQLMENRIAKDPLKITDADWTDYASRVNKTQLENTRFKFIQAMKEKQQSDDGISTLVKNYGSVEAHANATDKVRNATFNKLVGVTLDKNPDMSHDEAQVQVAATAGIVPPVFTETLKGKLWSGDPVQMDSAVTQIHELQSLKATNALQGLNDKDLALFAQYEATRNPADPTVGAKLIVDSKSMDSSVMEMVNKNWESLVYKNTIQVQKNTDDWVLQQFGFSKSSGLFGTSPAFDSPFMRTNYASDILNKYKSFYEASRGDDAIAKKLTQDYVNSNYGLTGVNGSSQWTLHPMENTIGFASGQGIDAIHADVMRQFAEPVSQMKEAYDKHAIDEYWEFKQPAKGSNEPIKFIKTSRDGLGVKKEEYPLIFIGTNFNKWDVAAQTAYGPRNIFLMAPSLGIMSYTPNRKWIIEENMGLSHTFPNEKYSAIIKQQLDKGMNAND